MTYTQHFKFCGYTVPRTHFGKPNNVYYQWNVEVNAK